MKESYQTSELPEELKKMEDEKKEKKKKKKKAKNTTKDSEESAEIDTVNKQFESEYNDLVDMI